MLTDTAITGKKKRTFWRVSRILFLVFIVICLVHLWLDWRNTSLMMKLRQEGLSTVEIQRRIHFLCGPLNVSAIMVLIGAGIAGIVERKNRRIEKS